MEKYLGAFLQETLEKCLNKFLKKSDTTYGRFSQKSSLEIWEFPNKSKIIPRAISKKKVKNFLKKVDRISYKKSLLELLKKCVEDFQISETVSNTIHDGITKEIYGRLYP